MQKESTGICEFFGRMSRPENCERDKGMEWEPGERSHKLDVLRKSMLIK